MPIEMPRGDDRPSRRQHFPSTAEFKVSPVSFPGQLRNFSCYSLRFALIKNQRRTEVAKRETNASPASQAAPDLHQRDQRNHFAVPRELQVKRIVPVGRGEHLRPGSTVKESVIRMRNNKTIPTGILKWIENC